MENEIKIGSKVSFKDGEDTFEGTVVENCYDNVYKVKVDDSAIKKSQPEKSIRIMRAIIEAVN